MLRIYIRFVPLFFALASRSMELPPWKSGSRPPHEEGSEGSADGCAVVDLSNLSDAEG